MSFEAEGKNEGTVVTFAQRDRQVHIPADAMEVRFTQRNHGGFFGAAAFFAFFGALVRDLASDLGSDLAVIAATDFFQSRTAALRVMPRSC